MATAAKNKRSLQRLSSLTVPVSAWQHGGALWISPHKSPSVLLPLGSQLDPNGMRHLPSGPPLLQAQDQAGRSGRIPVYFGRKAQPRMAMTASWVPDVDSGGGIFRMTEEIQRSRLRLTCPPCGEVFTADNEDALIAMAVEHAQKFHDINLLEEHGPDEFRSLVRRENETYWARIADLVPDGHVKTVLDEELCPREREIVSYVVHGFPNREIAQRLCISERTVSTHLVNIYEKLNVHSRAELAAMVRATDRIIEAALRGDGQQEYGPFVHANGLKPR